MINTLLRNNPCLNAIWQDSSFLNNSYENRLFCFAFIRPISASNLEYQRPESESKNLKTIRKILLFLEKICLSILSLMPFGKGKINRTFQVVADLKTKAENKSRALQAASRALQAADRAKVLHDRSVVARNKADLAVTTTAQAAVKATAAAAAQKAIATAAKAQAAADHTAASAQAKKATAAAAVQKAIAAAAKAQAAADHAAASAQRAHTLVTKMEANRAQDKANNQGVLTSEELQHLFPDKRKLLEKYSLFLGEPNEHGFCEGYIKRSPDRMGITWSKCYVNLDEDAYQRTYYANFPNEDMETIPPTWENPRPRGLIRGKPVSYSLSIVLANETLNEVSPLLKKRFLHGKLTPDQLENAFKTLRTQAEAIYTIQREKEERDKAAAVQAKLEREAGTRAEYAILLGKVKELFIRDNSADASTWSIKAREVDEYIQKKLALFSQGKDVALPHFFHATGKQDDPTINKFAYVSIIRSGQIDATFGIRGKGAYASTYDEASTISFGLFSFALDEREIYRQAGRYFQGRKRKLPEEIHDSLWVRTAGTPIKITHETVAHLVGENPQMCAEMRDRLQQLKFNVPVLTREASRYITCLFDRAGKIHRIPEQDWLWLDAKDLNDDIPGNVQPPAAPSREYVEDPE